MEKNFDIERLLDTKSFDQLNDREKTFVLSQLSEEEYQNLRTTADSLKKEFQKDRQGPSSLLKEKVLNQFLADRPKPTPLWKRPVPLWQVLTAMAASVLILFWFRPVKEILVIPEPEQVMVYQTDTIVQRDTVEKVVYRTKEIIKRIEVPVEIPTPSTPEEKQMLQAKAPEKGRSAKQVKDLMVFFSPSVKK